MIHVITGTYDSRHKPEYGGLSYTWGTSDLSKYYVNVHSCPVTPNLLAALWKLLINQCKEETEKRRS